MVALIETALTLMVWFIVAGITVGALLVWHVERMERRMVEDHERNRARKRGGER